MIKDFKSDHFKDMEELLRHLTMWEYDVDYYAYCRFFSESDAYSLNHYINQLQQDLEKANKVINDLEEYLSNELKDSRPSDLWGMGCYDEDKLILDKIKELKGDDKE